MKKIKSIKLKKDFRTINNEYLAGYELKKSFYQADMWELGYGIFFEESAILKCKTGLFDIEYEQNYFEIPDYYKPFYTNKEHDTLNYMNALAEHLNDGWKYREGSNHKILMLSNGHKFQLVEFIYSLYQGIKFSPNIRIEQIEEKCDPEMLQRYIELLKK